MKACCSASNLTSDFHLSEKINIKISKKSYGEYITRKMNISF